MIQVDVTRLTPTKFKLSFTDNTTTNNDRHIEIQKRVSKTAIVNVRRFIVNEHTPCNREIEIDKSIPIFNQLELWITDQPRKKISKIIKDFEDSEIKVKKIEPHPTEYHGYFDRLYDEAIK